MIFFRNDLLPSHVVGFLFVMEAPRLEETGCEREPADDLCFAGQRGGTEPHTEAYGWWCIADVRVAHRRVLGWGGAGVPIMMGKAALATTRLRDSVSLNEAYALGETCRCGGNWLRMHHTIPRSDRSYRPTIAVHH